MFVLPPPLPACLPSIQCSSSLTLRHHHLIFQRALSPSHPQFNSNSASNDSLSTSDEYLHSGPDAEPQYEEAVAEDGQEEEQVGEEDTLSLQSRRYDFTPLLEFLSSRRFLSESETSSESPDTLDPAEFQLAESYRAVPASLWHYLLKSVSASSTSVAYALVSWLQRHNLCFSYELLYSILINTLGRSEKLYEAYLLSQKQTLSPLTYNALIGACARNDDLEKALNLMSRMRQDGYQSDFVNYSLMIQSLIRSNKVDSSMLRKIFKEIEYDKFEMDSQLFNDVIVGFAKSGDATNAVYFLGMAQAYGLSLKTATLVSVIYALGNSGNTEEAEAVFEEIRDGGLKPRARAYNALLRGYVKSGSLRDAESIVSEMERNRVMPDEHTYGLLVDAYANAGRWESARIVLKEMEASNFQPNSFVFSRILASYRDRGEWQRTFQVLKEMKSCGVQPDLHFYNVMIDTFGKYNCLDHAMSTFERMLSEGIEPDNVTWNTLIDCHCKYGWHDRAEELFEEMKDKGYSPCTTTYNIMINSYGEQQRWDDVKNLFLKMKNEGQKPNVVTYTTLVDIYGQSGRFNDAMECLQTMKSGGVKPSSTIYNALINAYAQRGMSDQAVDAFRIMRADGLKPSLLALNSLINAFGEDRRDVEAFTVLQYMKENDVKPDVVTYTTLMKALIRVDKFQKVPDAYEEMILSGCMPDRKARAMLRSALRYMKQTLKSRTVPYKESHARFKVCI